MSNTVDIIGGEFFDKQHYKYEIRKEKIKDTKHTRYHVLLDDNIGAPEEYRRHFDLMREATKNDEIVFYISSYGGYLDTTVAYVYAMLDTKAKTKSVIYTAASAATLIAFAADEVDAKPIGTIMLHNFSVQQQGKGNELRAKTAFDDKQFKAMCDMLYKGIVTDEEVKDLQLDKDFWMLGRELKERMKKLNWKPLRERKEYGNG